MRVSPAPRASLSLFALAVAAIAGACAAPVGSPTAPHPGVGTDSITVAGAELSVWVADTTEERAQGLRGVQSLPDGIDGMLFVWEAPSHPSFGMRDTLIPLDLWWFDPSGSLIGSTTMPTCAPESCASYGAPGEVRWALETPAGAREFHPGARLTTSANG